MIIVDTNIISYFYLPTPYSEAATRAYQKNPVWLAPVLWRSEFRSVLTLYLRKKLVSFEDALSIQTDAERLMEQNEFDVQSIHILTLVNKGSCSAYDCEFIALAQHLSLNLLTEDQKILKEFPETAISLHEYLKA